MDNATSAAPKASWIETASILAGISGAVCMSLADLLRFRQFGVVADVLGILGGVLLATCLLPGLRNRTTERRTVWVVGAACLAY